jgi:hypothetical protein
MTDNTMTKPLLPDEVEWRIQSTSKDGSKTTVVPYIQNRAVMNRLDMIYGEMNWRNEYREWKAKGVLCGISIYDAEKKEWVTKWDGADDTNIEPTKGGLSDAMKRCAVQWGMGRELYQYPRIFIEGDHKYIPNWAADKLDKVVTAYIDGKLTNSIYTLKQN